jgi:hypothetical protein
MDPVIISITVKQRDLLATLQANVARTESQSAAAQDVLHAALSAITSGHDIDTCRVLSMGGTPPTLTVLPVDDP